MLDVQASLAALDLQVRAESVRHADRMRVLAIARERLTTLQVAQATLDLAKAEAITALQDVGGVSAASVEAPSSPPEPKPAPQAVKAAKGPSKLSKKIPAKKVSVLELQLLCLLRAATGPVKPDELVKDLASRGRTLQVSSVRTTLSHSALFAVDPGRQGWVLAPASRGVEVPDDIWPAQNAVKPNALRRLNGAGDGHDHSVGV